jgi:tartrate-resistant acid phosphatase type 5
MNMRVRASVPGGPVCAPVLSIAQSTRFAVIGDYGNGYYDGTHEAAVAGMVASWSPDFIITTGDNNYDSGSAATIDANIGQYYSNYIYPYVGNFTPTVSITQNLFFPSLGNHDWATAGAVPYLNYFTLPGNERYYDFVWGPVHFFALDSYSSEPDGITQSSTQATWLNTQLASSSSKWNLVYQHHPPFSSGTVHGSTPDAQWPYKSWGATAVLSGHEHDYERIIRNGLAYFVNGAGGKSLYSFRTPIAGSEFRYNANYGAILVTADDSSIKFDFYSVSNTASPLDTYTVTVPASINRVYLPLCNR